MKRWLGWHTLVRPCRRILEAQRQEALTTIEMLQGQLKAAQQAEAGFHKLLNAAGMEAARLSQQNYTLKRAVEKHDERAREAQRTLDEQEQRIQQLSTVAQNLFRDNEALRAEIAQLRGNGADTSTGFHFPKYGGVQ